MSFSEKLKTLRLENHMTQDYVAKRINVARSTIAGYETKNRQPSHEKLTAFANLFHVSVDYLLDDDETIVLSLSQSGTSSIDDQELLSKYHNLSSRSKEDLFTSLQLLELRDEKQNQL